MTANGFRIVALNGLLMLAAAMLLAGLPLIWAVGREFYHSPQPIQLPGSEAAWLSAHVVGLTSALAVIAVAHVTRLKPMPAWAELSTIWALVVAGWANTIGPVSAALLGVRGIELDWDWANNLIVSLFSLAAMAMLYAIAVAVIHLWRPLKV